MFDLLRAPSRTPSRKSALMQAAAILGFATAGALVNMTIAEIGRLIDEGFAQLTESEVSLEREVSDLERQLAEKRERLAAIAADKQTLADAHAETGS